MMTRNPTPPDGRRLCFRPAALLTALFLLLGIACLTACVGNAPPTDTIVDTTASSDPTTTHGEGWSAPDTTARPDTTPSDVPPDTPSESRPETSGGTPDSRPESPIETEDDRPMPPADAPDEIIRPPVETADDSAPPVEGSPVYDGLMIAAVHGTGKKGAEAVVDHGFVRLYNNTARAISLKDTALYYKTEGNDPYAVLSFADDAYVPAKGSYLIRANAPADLVEGNLVMKITAYDAEWDIHIDNKEVCLLLAPAGLSLSANTDITTLPEAISVFYASTVSPKNTVCAVDDLTRNKIAVRTALEDYSGYHLVNLTRTTTADLQALVPTTAKGEKNQVVASRLTEVIFSHAAGIYEEAFDLTLYAPEGYTIYYTDDGSDPSQSSNRARKKYTGKIRLSDTSAMAWGETAEMWYECPPAADTQIGGRVIKACAVKGSSATPVYTNTYFITDDLTPLGVTVMSISIPVDEMLGDGFYENFCPSGMITATRPRGVGILEVFDPNGQRVGHSRVEMAVSGNGSSHTGMKSLRIYYKSKNNQDAGLRSDLDYDLFRGLARDADGEAITSFSRLLLRNSGNDVGHSYIRDAYMQRVSAGLKVDTMAAATVLVFINGDFWGVYNARERYSPEYVESHYGVQKENVTVIESDYAALVYGQDPGAPYIVSSGEEGDADDFNALVDYIRTHDLTDATHYAYVCDRLDLDSLIDLWVARLYFNARDFPENNMKLWRNKNPDDPSGMDTKWHFALLDMDMGFAYFPTGAEHDTGEQANYFTSFFNEETVFGYLTLKLLENTEFRTRFLVRFYEVLKYVYTEVYLSDTLEAYIAERTPLMSLQEGRWLYNGASVYTWESDCADMRTFVAERGAYAMQYLLERFDVTEEQLRAWYEDSV